MNVRWLLFSSFFVSVSVTRCNADFRGRFWDPYERKYGSFPTSTRLELRELTREMFTFGFDNYMKYAFPKDELDPIHCTGRGPDYANPSNININDVLGEYGLTLIDSLDTLAIMGNATEFQRAVKLVIETISFDKPTTVQIFEATIRVLGALLSAHMILTDPLQPFGQMAYPGYNDELLQMAHDLGSRLLPAFENSATGIPHPRVNLQSGVPVDTVNETCTAGAGTLSLEFGVLSRLLKDPVYDGVARRAVDRLWSFRSNVTGLFGNVINIQTGRWVGTMSGLGAGLDSFYEYLLKSFILFGDEDALKKFNESYESIKFYMRRGRKHCNHGSGFPPIYVNVNMFSGDVLNNWVDSLQAAWPAVQVLIGDLEEAICSHAFYYAIWQRFNGLPERYNWNLQAPEVSFYPLRPELIESTYYLYLATKNPFYLHVGRDILYSLNNYTRVRCGFATRHDVTKNDFEDRMESFFLGETCKYLYLLFDEDNHANRETSRYIFSTEGHIFPIKAEFRRKTWEEDASRAESEQNAKKAPEEQGRVNVVVNARPSNATSNCERLPDEMRYLLPIQSRYLQQVRQLVGLD